MSHWHPLVQRSSTFLSQALCSNSKPSNGAQRFLQKWGGGILVNPKILVTEFTSSAKLILLRTERGS